MPGSSVPNVSSDQWLEVKVPINQGSGQVWRIGVEMRLKDGCTYESSYVDDVGW